MCYNNKLHPKENPYIQQIEQIRRKFCRLEKFNAENLNPPSKKFLDQESSQPGIRTFVPHHEAVNLMELIYRLEPEDRSSFVQGITTALQGNFALPEITPLWIITNVTHISPDDDRYNPFNLSYSSVSFPEWYGVSNIHRAIADCKINPDISLFGQIFTLCHETAHHIIRINDAKYTGQFGRFQSNIERTQKGASGWEVRVKIEIRNPSESRASDSTEIDCNIFAWDMCYYLWKTSIIPGFPEINPEIWGELPDHRDPTSWPKEFWETHSYIF